MMNIRKKLVVAALLTAVLAMGAVPGMVLADDETPCENRVCFIESVADYLGITEEELQDVLTEARSYVQGLEPEERADAFKEKVDELLAQYGIAEGAFQEAIDSVKGEMREQFAAAKGEAQGLLEARRTQLREQIEAQRKQLRAHLEARNIEMQGQLDARQAQLREHLEERKIEFQENLAEWQQQWQERRSTNGSGN